MSKINQTATHKRYLERYCPLIIDFVESIRNTDYNKVPQPFLPLFGQGYEKAETRIAFVGIETRGWGNMTDFVNAVDEHPEEALLDEFTEFDKLEFCDWGNNFGNTFWDFNFKFLAQYYSLENWKQLKWGDNEEILRSFAWGNTNSIEGFSVTAEKKGVKHENWLAVKQASKRFDKGKYILETLQPHIMVVMSWHTPEDWLCDGIDDFLKDEIDDYFWYYFIANSETHVLWTAHPTWLSKNVDFDEHINTMVNFAKSKLKAI
jgi:hypothetical protein